MTALDAVQGPEVYAVQSAGYICVLGFIVIVSLYKSSKWDNAMRKVQGLLLNYNPGAEVWQYSSLNWKKFNLLTTSTAKYLIISLGMFWKGSL